MVWRLLICLALGLCAAMWASADTLWVAGSKLSRATFIEDAGDILAPLGPTLRLLGAHMTVDGDTITLTTYAERRLVMTVGAVTADSDGERYRLAAAPRRAGDTLLLPAKSLAAWLGAEATYDAAARTLTLLPIATVQCTPSPDKVRITISSPAPLQFTSGRVVTPPRAYFDFKHVALGLAEQMIAVEEGMVDRVRVARFSTTPAVMRLVVDFRGDAVVTQQVSEQGHLVTLTVIAPTDAPPLPALPAVPTKPARLLGTAVVQRSPSLSEVMIATEGPVQVSAAYDARARHLILHIPNGINALPEQAFSALDDPYVQRVTAEGAADRPGTRLVIALKRGTGYQIEHDPNFVHVMLGTADMTGLRVVLDAGHGGYDTGAIGIGGAREKEINLDVVLRAQRLLAAAGITTLLTREDDTFIPLDDRPGLANARHADLFVAVHCNSNPNRNSRTGTETYYNTAQSYLFAKTMQSEMVQGLEMRDGGVRHANFVVLRKSEMPAVLVELGYLNHSDDVAKLQNPAFRQQAAEALVSGIRRYATATRLPWQTGTLPRIRVAGLW